MQLDASGFQTVLTPEVALGIVQKSLAKKNWKKYDVSSIKCVYTPYWIFSFDVLAEGSVPTGKAAINAYTGELNEFVPVLLERPLKKTREVGKECEVEQTAVTQAEVKEAAAAKVAAHAGIKKDSVAISAIIKIYAPVYRIWIDVADDTFKVDVDACLGAGFGFEAIPAREKDWNEVTSETLEKMKTPKGLAELGAQTVGAVAGAAGGKGGGGKGNPANWLMGSREGHYVILAVVIVFAAWYLFARPLAYSVSCEPAAQFTSTKSDLFSSTKILVPKAANLTNHIQISGKCAIVNKGSQPLSLVVKVFVKEDGTPNNAASTSVFVNELAPSDVGVSKDFSITWNKTAGVKQYLLATEILS